MSAVGGGVEAPPEPDSEIPEPSFQTLQGVHQLRHLLPYVGRCPGDPLPSGAQGGTDGVPRRRSQQLPKLPGQARGFR